MREEKNPWNPPPEREGNLDLIKIWAWFKIRSRTKLRASLRASRERYRQALHYKDEEDT